MFELSHLRSFVAVASEMNFHRAAERLNMTQPPLSRQIQLLERSLGVQLFDRSGRSIRITAAGQKFLLEAEDILRRAQEAALSARSAALGDEGSIRLAFVPIAALGVLPRIVEAVRRELPGVKVNLHEMVTIDQIEALSAGRIDLGIMRPVPGRRRVEMECIFSEPFRLALHQEHPLTASSELEIEDIDEQDFLMYAPSNGWYGYEILNAVFSARKVRPNIVQHFGQTLTMLSMVNIGLGMALVPRSSREISFQNVVYRPISLPDDTSAEIYLGWSGAHAEDPVLERVRRLLMKAPRNAKDTK